MVIRTVDTDLGLDLDGQTMEGPPNNLVKIGMTQDPFDLRRQDPPHLLPPPLGLAGEVVLGLATDLPFGHQGRSNSGCQDLAKGSHGWSLG